MLEHPKRGAFPTPRSTLIGATPMVLTRELLSVAPNFLVKPTNLSDWGNIANGDCVTAEEAFAKACNNPEIRLSDDIVENWAKSHGVFNGANITDVMKWMQNDGFVQSPLVYCDGGYVGVPWTNASSLQSAITQGPVKLGVASDQLDPAWEAGGRKNGWFGLNFRAETNYDHCISLCGYGSINYLAQQLGVSVPAGVDGTKLAYAAFTWGAIGILDAPSMLAITNEAWLRQPTTTIKSQISVANTLAFIKTANTPNGHVEVHLASGGSGYYTRTLEVATTFGNERDGTWQLLPSQDLVFIKTANTPNAHVEVHIASRGSNYNQRTLEVATTFSNETDGTWQLLPSLDLVFIKTSGTPNGHVEVHIASRSSTYKTRTFEVATTFVNETDGVWQLLPNLDLVFIKTSGTPNGHVEVHIASHSSRYTQRTLETATTFVNEGDGTWQLLPNLDLVFIKTANTPNAHVEVHIASRSSNYTKRTIETPTTFVNETDGVWSIL